MALERFEQGGAEGRGTCGPAFRASLILVGRFPRVLSRAWRCEIGPPKRELVFVPKYRWYFGVDFKGQGTSVDFLIFFSSACLAI